MDNTIATGIMDGVNITLAKLVLELQESGLISASDFANSLRQTASEARTSTPLQSEFRVDVLMQEKLADLLDTLPQKWVPVVIEGGKSSKTIR